MIIIGSYYYNFILLLLAQYTDDNGLELGGLFDGLKRNVKDYSDAIEKIKGLDSLDIFKNGKVDIDAFTKAVGTSDSILIGYTETLKDTDGVIDLTTASTEGLSAYLEKSGNGFQFAAIKATLLNTALNAGIFLVASVAIQGIAKALDNYIHRVENARERTSELFDEFKQMNNTLADHRKTVSELADRYDELSKGVNLSTNENVSLSTEEYEEFLDINEQLTQSFPELAKGIDENGNSILTLGTKGITAKEELEKLLQTEEDLNNFRIAQGLEDAFKGVYTYVEDANEATEKLNGTISDSSEAMSKLQDIAENGIKLTGENGQLIFAGNTNNQAELDYMNSLTASVNEFWKSLDGNRRVELDTLGINDANLFSFNQDEYTGAFEVYSQAFNLTPEELTALENIIQDNVGDASGALLDSISDQSQELQEQIQQGENAWRDFIPNLVSGMKSKQTFKDLDSDLQDIAVQIVEGLDYSYATAMNEYHPDPYAYIRDKFIVPMGNLIDSDKQKLQSSFEELFKLDAENISQSNQAEIEKLITTIATLLEKDPLEIRVALGFDVGDDAKKRLQNSIRQIADDHGLTDRAQVAQLNEYTDKLKLSEIELWLEATQGAKNATEAIEMYEAALVKSQQTANETPVSFNFENFSSVVNALASVQSLYTDFKEKVDEGIDFTFDFSDIEGLRETFTNLGVPTAQFDAFEKVLSSSSTTASEAQAEFNAMATSLIYSTGCLDGLNSSNRDLIVSQLELQGILNASSVVTEELAMASEVLAQNGYSLADASETAYWSILNEAGASEATKAALYALNAAEIAYSNNGFSTQEKIDQLGDLAKKYGDTATAAIAAAAADRVAAGHGDYESVLADMMAQVNRATQNIHIELPEVDARKAKGSASKAGKDVGKSYKDALKEQLNDLDSVISGITGRIDDQISSINEQKSAALDSIDAQKEALEEAKDAAVEALEAERDARLEVIETQRKQIEQNIKEKQKAIDQINEEIENIRRANEERTRELDLAKAKYNLEKMQNQKTKLVK